MSTSSFPTAPPSEQRRRDDQRTLRDPEFFALRATGRHLRSYQREILGAVVDSIRYKLGHSFVVMFPRQSGKNELQALLFAYLMALLEGSQLNIISISPTYRPQTLNAMRRLEGVLTRCVPSTGRWRRESGYILRQGKARVIFLSGEPTANVVGETAHMLISVDEAQDVEPARFDRAFAPMAAARNATRIFWGTAWTSTTLLAREKRRAEAEQRADHIRRLWLVDGSRVAAEVPEYAAFLKGEIRRLGSNHPIIRTQYFCQEIDAQTGMFPPGRLALMQADGPGREAPVAGEVYAFCIDPGGQAVIKQWAQGWLPGLEDPGTDVGQAQRDSSALSIVQVDLSTLETLQAPTYRIVQRRQWTGVDHRLLFGQLKALGEAWRPQHIVIDATGVGEGLWSLLESAFPGRVLPVKFSQAVKSELGWRFLSVIETGRLRDCAPCEAARAQYAACRATLLPGAGQVMRWGVPEGARGPDGEAIHDDMLLADALVARLDRLAWRASTRFTALDGEDVLKGAGENW